MQVAVVSQELSLGLVDTTPGSIGSRDHLRAATVGPSGVTPRAWLSRAHVCPRWGRQLHCGVTLAPQAMHRGVGQPRLEHPSQGRLGAPDLAGLWEIATAHPTTVIRGEPTNRGKFQALRREGAHLRMGLWLRFSEDRRQQAVWTLVPAQDAAASAQGALKTGAGLHCRGALLTQDLVKLLN